MDTTQRQYTAEFKREAVATVMEQSDAITVAAQNLGITAKIRGGPGNQDRGLSYNG